MQSYRNLTYDDINLLSPKIFLMKEKVDKQRFYTYEKLQSMRNTLIQEMKKSRKIIPGLKTIDKVLHIYEIKTKDYDKNWQSNCEILVEFAHQFSNSRGKTICEAMYIKLFNAIYKTIEENINQYSTFLQEIDDPIIYITNVKKKEKQLLLQKVTTENMNYTLGDGSKLPPMQIDDNELRRRTPNRQ